MAHYQLDARRLLCPLPVIRTQDRVKQLLPGDVLDIVATDPGVLQDIPAWARLNGHRLLTTRREGWEVWVTLTVGQQEN